MTTSRLRAQLAQAKREQSAAQHRFRDAYDSDADNVTVGWFNARRGDADQRVADLENDLRAAGGKR